MTTSRPADDLRKDDKRDEPKGNGGPAGAIANWVDERTGAAKGARFLMKKVFPDHWSFMLGEIAMYSLIILLLTGTFLTFWFVPSMGETVYNGSYVPLKGVQMSEAFKSTVNISMDVRGGLLIRQIHHWAALLFLVSIMLHMARVFFTGAFRKPREINWIIGLLLFMLAMVEGFAGYSLPDDLLSGTGIRAAEGFMLSIPVIGSYVASLVFGGGFPGEAIIPRLFTVHVLLLPAIIVGLFTAHIILVMVHKHTQYPGPGRTNKNVVGFPLMPVYTAKAGGFFFIVFGVTALISGLVTINPIWMYGPYEPTMVTAGSQPDWYMGFADGALRLLPGRLEFTLLEHTFVFNVFIGAILLIPLMWTAMGIYPFLEKWVTGDNEEHHLLDRPRNAPTRTGIGMAFFVFYFVLFFAAGNDLMAIKLHLSINDITWAFRILTFLGPVMAFWITKRLCLSLQRRDRDLVLHGRETGRIIRTAEGRFFEAHEPLNRYQRWPLVSFASHAPVSLPAGIDRNGVRRRKAAADKMRVRLSHFFFNDRIEPVTPAELEAAHHHDEPVREEIDHTVEEARRLEGDDFGGKLHGGAEELSSSSAYGHPDQR
ncbi:ubiquinol-cytochrome c reductase cytochrome b subunit [Calidifontibacter sp. DB0510]|uniref:Cytochrome bc1 complex cytochrome b subunit n=1 Tax=Metallococcus carri TaxID=1656884 RepID=A0A967AZG7_9MICO|nr:ubiquinol-cytochrome c reductase cytochrome b subunit [Metallococcus carri]NHN55956.1 ubiquinol-cytochrome c reductase cytochrome b subunit [Metallococcus carri]NOP37587.1 ubiquinol-cytochrome c reductase cytochrome b subunit [Calidifontibacter sp. DB2511S]